MAVTVGSARIDEQGQSHSGKAGDQTGKEVSRQSWYKHSKGWRVFRAKDAAKAERIARCMEMACDNEKIGYDQYQRNTLYKYAEAVGFDVSKVTTACETDCSALVRVCCAYAGIMGLPSDFRTGNMPKNLMNTGEFAELTGSKYTDQSVYLGVGDILVTKTSGHTVVVLSNGSRYEGSAVARDYEPGERLLKKGVQGADVKKVQQWLLELGYDLGSCGADGDFGAATEKAVKAFQKGHGLEADGQYGPMTHAAMEKAMNRKPVTAAPAEPEPTPEPSSDPTKGGILTVNRGAWNVRTGPGKQYGIVGVVNAGQELQPAQDGEWTPVIVGGEVRWISTKAFES